MTGRKIVFACAVHRPVSQVPAWEPVIEDVRRAHGRFPCLWAIDRTLAAGLAIVTRLQRTALEYQPHIVFADYELMDQPARTLPGGLSAVQQFGLLVHPVDTVREVFLRAVHRAQPGWTWETVESLLAQNFGVR
jgi:hypothetical protein